MMTALSLETHLASLGWRPARVDDRTFRCAHTTAEGEVIVFVRTDENWFMASVVPVFRPLAGRTFELSRWLLRVNRDMVQSKFAYDPKGDVVLTVELPLESLDAGEIRTALTDLLANAVAHRRTLREAAS